MVCEIVKFPETLYFTIMFTRAHHLYLSLTNLIQSKLSYCISFRSTEILSSHLHLGLPDGLFSPAFSTKNLHAFLFSTHMRHIPHPPHHSYHSNNKWWGKHIMKLLIMQFSALPCYFLHLSPNTFLRTLYTMIQIWRSITEPAQQINSGVL